MKFRKIKTKLDLILSTGLSIIVLVPMFLAVAWFANPALALTNTTTTTTPKQTTTTTKTTTTTTPTAASTEKVDTTGNSGFVICGNTADTPCNITHLFRAFIIIINYMISMAGLVAILFIVIAGVQMSMSRGEEWMRSAKQRMTGAVFGLVLVATAFVVINSLLSGSLSLGIQDGANIIANPREYINQGQTPPSSTTPTPPTK